MKYLKEKALGAFIALCIVSISFIGIRYVYDKGIAAGINQYHTACRIGGILIDENNKAVWCKPIDVEKEEMKSAPGLLS